MIQRYADVCHLLGKLLGKLADVDALGYNLVKLMATAFSCFWLFVECRHVGGEHEPPPFLAHLFINFFLHI